MDNEIHQSTCVYCGHPFDANMHKKTREHVIPHSIIELFPEQNIVFSKNGTWRDANGQMTKDVCASCNNTVLSALDAYGVELIRTSFLNPISLSDKDNTFPVNLDYPVLSKWILKIAYNNSRVLGL